MSESGAYFMRSSLSIKPRLAERLLGAKIKLEIGASISFRYYLIHASNSLKAVLLMKEIMWPLGDEEGTFDFSGDSQGVLISQTPRVEELQSILLREFAGQQVAFDDIRGKTWNLPFIEKHYRSVLQELRSSGTVEVTPVTSRGTGLSRHDLVRFPKE
jgi:hypothetical protein